MLDAQPTPTAEELDRAPVALLAPPRHPNYDTDEGRVFREALAIIQNPNRWCQFIRHLPAETEQFCALGGIGQASHRDPWFCPRDNYIADSVVNALAWTIRHSGCKSTYDAQSIVADHNNTHRHSEHIAVWHQCGKENGWL